MTYIEIIEYLKAIDLTYDTKSTTTAIQALITKLQSVLENQSA